MINKNYQILYIFLLLLFLGCNSSVINTTILPHSSSDVTYRPVYFSENDTTNYVLSFTDKKEYKLFRSEFEKLFNSYALDTINADTMREYFHLALFRKNEEELNLEIDTLILDSIDNEMVLPDKFGTISIYTGKEFYDEFYTELTSRDFFNSSFSDSISDYKYLDLKKMTTKLYSLVISDISNQKGEPISAFTIAKSWNKLVKARPALGRAIFKSVKGLNEFIAGQEAVISGVRIRNNNRIDFQTSVEDTLFNLRISNPYIFSGDLDVGPYFSSVKNANQDILLNNPNSVGVLTPAKKYILIKTEDTNPMVSLSLKKYDAMPIYKKRDLQYAEKIVVRGGQILPLQPRFYFAILNSISKSERNFLASKIDGNRILQSAVMAQGEGYSAANTSGTKPSNSINIVFNKNDPVSRSIAEKIFADLKVSGITSTLQGKDITGFQRDLVSNKFVIAIGSASEDEINSDWGKLLLSDKWFDNNRSFEELIQENYLHKLFRLNRFLLCNKNISIINGDIKTIYKLAK